MNAYSAYRKLTPDQKSLLRNKQIDVSQSPDAWLALLGPVSAYDAAGDKARKLGCTALVIGGIFLFIDIFLLAMFWPLGVLLLLLAISMLVVGAIIYFPTRKLDINMDLRKFVLPVIGILREDISPTELLHLRLDLRGGPVKEKLIKKGDQYSRGVYHKIIDSFYLDPWIEGQMVLSDGSRLQWKIIDRIRQSSKTKRTPRGKYKTKTKTKQKTHLFVQVGLPEKRYDVKRATEHQKLSDITIASGEKRSTVKIHRVIQSDGSVTLEPAQFLGAIAEAFRRAVPGNGKK